jgi:hypothetical protein
MKFIHSSDSFQPIMPLALVLGGTTIVTSSLRALDYYYSRQIPKLYNENIV